MTDFIINNNFAAKGEMSVQQELVNSTIIVTGTIQLNSYIDDIKSIESKRFLIDGVQVIKESFGTSDDTVVYEFIASSLKISSKTY